LDNGTALALYSLDSARSILLLSLKSQCPQEAPVICDLDFTTGDKNEN
jgi:hypothetical protein